MAVIAALAGYCLLFFLVFGMSATVDIGCLLAQLSNKKAILIGVFLQFVVLPFLGFVVVKVLNLSHAMGITLLVVTSSPGGSYSNWWCSLFNADLALSVTLTAISTVLSIIMLPLNLLLYTRFAYNDDIIKSLDWKALFISIAVVISAISLGLYMSEKFNSHSFNLQANRIGNISGILLVIFSAIMSNTDADSQLWDRDWKFFLGVAAPCALGLLFANVMTTCTDLNKPERVTVSIECCYQNVGIATSVALSMFNGDELSEAMGVPFYYGVVEGVLLGIYCLVVWKMGWTKAPADENIWKVLVTPYEVLYAEKAEAEQALLEETTIGAEHVDDDAAQFHFVENDDEIPAPPVLPESPDSPKTPASPVRRKRRSSTHLKEPSHSVSSFVVNDPRLSIVQTRRKSITGFEDPL